MGVCQRRVRTEWKIITPGYTNGHCSIKCIIDRDKPPGGFIKKVLRHMIGYTTWALGAKKQDSENESGRASRLVCHCQASRMSFPQQVVGRPDEGGNNSMVNWFHFPFFPEWLIRLTKSQVLIVCCAFLNFALNLSSEVLVTRHFLQHITQKTGGLVMTDSLVSADSQ